MNKDKNKNKKSLYEYIRGICWLASSMSVCLIILSVIALPSLKTDSVEFALTIISLVLNGLFIFYITKNYYLKDNYYKGQYHTKNENGTK